MQNTLGSDRTAQIINSLHAILKPFLLRRLKSDVEANLPPKKEYVLYAPLSVTQREAYDKVLDGSLRAYLMQTKAVEGTKVAAVEPEDLGPRKLRNHQKDRPSYIVDEDDDEYFEKLEKGEIERRKAEKALDLTKLSEAHRQEVTRMFGSFLWRFQLTLSCRKEGQQYEITEHCDAAPKGLLTSILVRLACRSHKFATNTQRRVGIRKWQDDGSGSSAYRVVQAQAQSALVQPVHHHA